MKRAETMEPQFMTQGPHVTRVPAELFTPEAPSPDRLIRRLRGIHAEVRFGALDASFADRTGDLADGEAAVEASRKGIAILAPGDLFQQMVGTQAFKSLLGSPLVRHGPLDPDAEVSRSVTTDVSASANPIARVLRLLEVLNTHRNVSFLHAVAQAFGLPKDDTGATLRALGDVFTALQEAADLAGRARIAGQVSQDIVNSINTLEDQLHSAGLNGKNAAGDLIQRLQPATIPQLQLLMALTARFYDEGAMVATRERIREHVGQLQELVAAAVDLTAGERAEMQRALAAILERLARSASAGASAVAEAAGMVQVEVGRWGAKSFVEKAWRIAADVALVIQGLQAGHSLLVPPDASFVSSTTIMLAPGAVANIIAPAPAPLALLPGSQSVGGSGDTPDGGPEAAAVEQDGK